MENIIELRNAEVVDKPAEGATLFALNPDGTINRIKADGVGGGKIAKLRMLAPGGTESAISLQNLKDGVMTAVDSAAYTATCDNMTYEEAVEVIQSGEPLEVYITAVDNYSAIASDYSASVLYNNDTIMIFFGGVMTELSNDVWYWTAGGISTRV